MIYKGKYGLKRQIAQIEGYIKENRLFGIKFEYQNKKEAVKWLMR